MIYTLDVIVVATLIALPFHLTFGDNEMAKTTLSHTLTAALDPAGLSPLSDHVGMVLQVLHPSWPTLVMYLTAALLLWILYAKIQRKFVLVRKPNKPRKNRGQRPSEFPPPFPNGWFVVAHSDGLRKGTAQELQVLGKHLVLFRAKSGDIGCLDAFCPHLGANLGTAGEVQGDCLRCCFHGWEFDVTGKCNKIPGTQAIPHSAHLKSHTIKEANGLIHLWHHADGEEPWPLEDLKELKSPTSWWSGGWYEGGRTWCHVNAHVQEPPENGADAAHLNCLHKDFVMDWVPKMFTHDWTVQWSPHVEKPYYSDVRLTQAIHVFGKAIPGTHVDVHIHQMGPGLVKMELTTPLGRAVVYECVTPHRTTTQIVRHVTYCQGTIPRLLGKYFMWSLEMQFQRDVAIWETKKYLTKPAIAQTDGPIMAFRRWFSQFYSVSSLTFSDALAKESMMDW